MTFENSLIVLLAIIAFMLIRVSYLLYKHTVKETSAFESINMLFICICTGVVCGILLINLFG